MPEVACGWLGLYARRPKKLFWSRLRRHNNWLFGDHRLRSAASKLIPLWAACGLSVPLPARREEDQSSLAHLGRQPLGPGRRLRTPQAQADAVLADFTPLPSQVGAGEELLGHEYPVGVVDFPPLSFGLYEPVTADPHASHPVPALRGLHLVGALDRVSKTVGLEELDAAVDERVPPLVLNQSEAPQLPPSELVTAVALPVGEGVSHRPMVALGMPFGKYGSSVCRPVGHAQGAD